MMVRHDDCDGGRHGVMESDSGYEVDYMDAVDDVDVSTTMMMMHILDFGKTENEYVCMKKT